MEQSPSLEANSHSVSQEIPLLLWNPQLHCRPYPDPEASSPPFPTYVRKVRINVTPHLLLGLPSGLFPSGFPTDILYAFVISSMHTTCPAPIILVYLIALIMFGEAYFHYAVFSSLPPLPHS